MLPAVRPVSEEEEEEEELREGATTGTEWATCRCLEIQCRRLIFGSLMWTGMVMSKSSTLTKMAGVDAQVRARG